MLTASDTYIERIDDLEDQALVALMLDALGSYEDGQPQVVAGLSEEHAEGARAVFAELACRFIPIDVCEAGLRLHIDPEWEPEAS